MNKFHCKTIDEVLERHGEHISLMLEYFRGKKDDSDDSDILYIMNSDDDWGAGCGFVYDEGTLSNSLNILFSINNAPHWDSL